mmetsp:Transcript_15505/g.34222  ORF Transcript_15505/g.34222 Transcript_15505/m.34222 type:complete len:122 (+) Transcript_15505:56-421(+)
MEGAKYESMDVPQGCMAQFRGLPWKEFGIGFLTCVLSYIVFSIISALFDGLLFIGIVALLVLMAFCIMRRFAPDQAELFEEHGRTVRGAVKGFVETKITPNVDSMKSKLSGKGAPSTPTVV